MNGSVIEKPLVLSLNKNWMRLGWITPKQAFVAMCGGTYGAKPPALAVAVTVDEDGKLTEAIPMTMEEWKKLPVREADLAIGTKDGQIRCPLIVIRPNFHKMPMKAPRLSSGAIFERDGGLDAYSGDYVPKSQGNVDHVVPKDRGGEDAWENLVWTKRSTNSKKGNKLNHEAGLVLRKIPKRPMPVPVHVTVKGGSRPEHKHFME